MSHDVFVSHSSRDKVVADAVVAGLEQESLRCWVAPRDVIPGSLWGAAIIEAIESAPVMVLILSAHSNGSPQVLREVERAVATNSIIVPFRIEEIDPSGAMAYYLATEHWLDALTPPVEAHIGRLASSIRALLGTEESVVLPPPVPGPVSETPRVAAVPGRRVLLVIGVVVSAVLLAGGLRVVAMRGGGAGDTATVADDSSTVADDDQPAATADETTDNATDEEPTTDDSTSTTALPPSMFEVPAGSLSDVVQAGNRWIQTHETDIAALGEEVLRLPAEGDIGSAALPDSPEAEELAQFAAPALCQLTEDDVAPDDIAAIVAAAAAEVSGQATVDYAFAHGVSSVATVSVCPDRATEWAIATGGLGAGLLLAEDFEDDASGWTTSSYGGGTISHENGSLRFLPNNDGGILESANPPGSYSDLIVDVWATQLDGPPGSKVAYGVNCRGSATGSRLSFYSFQILGDGSHEIWRYDDRWIILASGHSGVVKRTPETNRISVACTGPLLALVVNGEVLAAVEDPTFAEGTVGLFASTGSSGVEVQFDNLTIRAPSDEAMSLLRASRG